MVTVTCGGCGKTGQARAADVPPASVPLCPDCETQASAILSEHFDAPVRSGSGPVIEDAP
jgi:hypothetical protein